MNYIINKDYQFEIFDDGDVIVSNLLKSKSFIINKSTWFIIQLFEKPNTYASAIKQFVTHYNQDEMFLICEFEKIFGNLLQNEIIKGV